VGSEKGKRFDWGKDLEEGSIIVEEKKKKDVIGKILLCPSGGRKARRRVRSRDVQRHS